MANIFIKNNLEQVLNSATESVIDFPKHINIIDNNKVNLKQEGGGYSATSSDYNDQNGGAYSATSSVFNGQNGGAYSATSSAFNGQNGGAYSATSENMSQKGGNVYSETSSAVSALKNVKYSATSSNANIQAGGSSYVAKQNNEYDVNKLLAMLTTESNMTDSEHTSVIENKLREALSNQAGGADNVISGIFSKIDQSLLNFTETEAESNNDDTSVLRHFNLLDLVGGARKPNPGFEAFQKLKKFVATELGISNGVEAAKIAGAAMREVKEKYNNLGGVEVAKKAKELFEKKKDHFKQMLPK